MYPPRLEITGIVGIPEIDEGDPLGIMIFQAAAHQGYPIKPGDISSMVEEVFEQPIDIVVFGRTLYSMVEKHDGILFVNPGSPSLPRNLRRLGNVAILDITNDTANANVLDLRDFS